MHNNAEVLRMLDRATGILQATADNDSKALAIAKKIEDILVEEKDSLETMITDTDTQDFKQRVVGVDSVAIINLCNELGQLKNLSPASLKEIDKVNTGVNQMKKTLLHMFPEDDKIKTAAAAMAKAMSKVTPSSCCIS
jgi:S-adenosylmethionine/arginine decarboxylase-like enzyme